MAKDKFLEYLVRKILAETNPRRLKAGLTFISESYSPEVAETLKIAIEVIRESRTL